MRHYRRAGGLEEHEVQRPAKFDALREAIREGRRAAPASLPKKSSTDSKRSIAAKDAADAEDD
jgi:hypothetical protein